MNELMTTGQHSEKYSRETVANSCRQVRSFSHALDSQPHGCLQWLQ